MSSDTTTRIRRQPNTRSDSQLSPFADPSLFAAASTLGYVYMSNTGGQGQLELVRMFYGQLKQGFIIDERVAPLIPG